MFRLFYKRCWRLRRRLDVPSKDIARHPAVITSIASTTSLAQDARYMPVVGPQRELAKQSERPLHDAPIRRQVIPPNALEFLPKPRHRGNVESGRLVKVVPSRVLKTDRAGTVTPFHLHDLSSLQPPCDKKTKLLGLHRVAHCIIIDKVDPRLPFHTRGK